MTELWNRLVKLFYPQRCACCKKINPSEKQVCEECETDLRPVDDPYCRKCGLPLKYCVCSDRNYLFTGAAAPFYNSGASQKGIYALKFGSHYGAAEFFGKKMAECYKKYFPKADAEYVCFVPMSRKGKKKRGYNQAELLAKSFAECTEIKLKDLFCEAKKHETQHTHSFEERIKNVKGVYKANCSLDGKTIVLIDDIRTTGATLNECAKQLRLAGAEKVYCISALVTVNTYCKPKHKGI